MGEQLLRIVKELQFRSPLRRYFFPRYTYNFTPAQLGFLVQALSDVRDVPGAVAEIGCARGDTTVFLNRHMTVEQIDKPYLAVDTFAGFMPEDVYYERAQRHKQAARFTGFRVNDQRWFEATVRANGAQRVKSIRADVNQLDLRTLGPLCFVLLDVDLYRPMAKALPELWEVLSPGGIMVVDDCNPDDVLWDGSDQAYKEFVAARGLEPCVVHGKLGLARKPAPGARP
jgi:SAM-dependent methyltransferase